MKDEERYKEIDAIFESYLSPKKNKLKLRVREISGNKILESSDMNYSKVFFDAELNMYKLDGEGKVVKVNNTNFEAVVMKQE